MIRTYTTPKGRLTPQATDAPDLDAIWIDLVDPTPDEIAQVSDRLGITIPDRADMDEIELSSRLYREKGAAVMTAVITARSDKAITNLAPVSFVLCGRQLVTVRFHDPRPFSTFPDQAYRLETPIKEAEDVLIGLLESIIDRLADLLEAAARDVDTLSRRIFRSAHSTKDPEDFQDVLQRIGAEGNTMSNIRDSLVTLERLAAFLGNVAGERGCNADVRKRIKTLSGDARSLTDHLDFVSQKLTFMLDASLGMINIAQNATIKIFSVVAVIFLPPTLIASIYGMNFVHMPELEWTYGYPMALGAMVAAAILPYLFFKYKGWL
ncbi:magnesium transporter [Loktanella fryxellensis]|uniref:Magnesium transport protein CorA n=1 Tax=Loktanella fryxellensis TaxID=245187 RepID=A0A1H8BPJ2_9RHOB|nr:magnesium transporter CorA family protein [Loktanella fryxellensis]SEM84459.1 magnesium transporter [Loktanella fryxellensis]